MLTLGELISAPYLWCMKTGMRASIRLFIERNLIADDPMPERSWLDQQDMPSPEKTTVLPARAAPVAGRSLTPLPPLPDRVPGHGRHQGVLGRWKARHKTPSQSGHRGSHHGRGR